VFIAAMLAGMLVFEWIEGARVRSIARPDTATLGASE
jgi:hypothetical protein